MGRRLKVTRTLPNQPKTAAGFLPKARPRGMNLPWGGWGSTHRCGEAGHYSAYLIQLEKVNNGEGKLI